MKINNLREEVLVAKGMLSILLIWYQKFDKNEVRNGKTLVPFIKHASCRRRSRARWLLTSRLHIQNARAGLLIWRVLPEFIQIFFNSLKASVNILSMAYHDFYSWPHARFLNDRMKWGNNQAGPCNTQPSPQTIRGPTNARAITKRVLLPVVHCHIVVQQDTNAVLNDAERPFVFSMRMPFAKKGTT